MRARRRQRVALRAMPAIPAATPSNGGFTFAERPELEAPDARILWRAELDPGALQVAAVPIDAAHPDAIEVGALTPWLTTVADAAGEHAVLSDGWRHIRIDIEVGSLAAGHPVIIHYGLSGVASAESRILPLRRLLDLYRRRRFSISLYPHDRRVDRWLLALRVHDALLAGATQREIATVLFGADPGRSAERGSDSLRSRVRRLVAEARRLAGGGYRLLMNARD